MGLQTHLSTTITDEILYQIIQYLFPWKKLAFNFTKQFKNSKQERKAKTKQPNHKIEI